MPCPICSDVNEKETSLDTMRQKVMIECHRCGRFVATDLFLGYRPNDWSPTQIGNASGWVRENPGVELYKDDWDFLKSIRTPSVGDKADKLLLFLARKYPRPNQLIKFHGVGENLSACWGANRDEANFIFHEYLTTYKGFINKPPLGGTEYHITPAGWDYLHSLQQTNTNSQIGFCAMWFDKSLTPLWLEGIEQAIQNAGYDAMRIDKHQHNNRIDDEIIAMIRRSKFIVADFTGNRGGVYFEAGYALGLGLQVIWTVREDELANIHFDNRQYSFIKWSDNAINEFRDNLQYRIEATIGRGPLRPSI